MDEGTSNTANEQTLPTHITVNWYNARVKEKILKVASGKKIDFLPIDKN